jgi:predicted AlkP superfamily phosphohydrolase/phosphomutase
VVRLPGLDRVSHQFLRYAMPASFGDVPADELEKYGAVLERYYRFLDDWIGRFLSPYLSPDGAGESGILAMIVSPHGIEPVALPGRLLLWLQGDRLQSGTHDRAPDGMIVAAGSGVSHGKPLGKASILDVTPTLLYELRLAIGMDMDGQPLTRLFEEATNSRRPVLLIPSYEGSRISGPKEAPGGP